MLFVNVEGKQNAEITNIILWGNDQEVEFHEIEIHFFMRSNS
jgi:hypothetical protein